jgi:hypothetical protein
MTLSTELASIPSGQAGPFPDQLQRAVSAYLARFKGSSHERTGSDLRCYLNWCAERGLDPLAAQRLHLELYIRWMQETRRFKPSTISRRFSVTAGFYRTCAIGGVLEHSPAEHVRRPAVPAESPTLASPTCSSRPCSPQPASHRIRVTSLWAMLSLLGLRARPRAARRRATDLRADPGRPVPSRWGDAFALWPRRRHIRRRSSTCGSSSKPPRCGAPSFPCGNA